MQTFGWKTSKNSKASHCQLADAAINQLHFDGTLDGKIEHLFDWHVEVLTKLIHQIVACCNVALKSSALETALLPMKSCHGEDTTLDKLKEVIKFTEFNVEVAGKQQNPDSVALDSEVVTQL